MPLSVLPAPCPGFEALLYPAQISPFPCRYLPSCSLAKSHPPFSASGYECIRLGGVWLVGGFTKVVATGKAVLERVPLQEELDEGREGSTGATVKGAWKWGGAGRALWNNNGGRREWMEGAKQSRGCGFCPCPALWSLPPRLREPLLCCVTL